MPIKIRKSGSWETVSDGADGADGASNIPTGCIMMFTGTTAPTGWQICNGSNGSPDLRNRFIVATGSSYSINATGGSNSVSLSTAQMPSHDHDAGATVNDPGHKHQLKGGVDDADSGSYISAGDQTGNLNVGAMNDAGSNITVSVDVHNAGSGSAHENRPPYYALTFIMKL